MGQKSNPKILRLGNKKTISSFVYSSWFFVWYQDQDKSLYTNLFLVDNQLLFYLKSCFYQLESYGEVLFVRRNFELDIRVKIFFFKRFLYSSSFLFSFLGNNLLRILFFFCKKNDLISKKTFFFNVNLLFIFSQFFYPESLFMDSSFFLKKNSIFNKLYSNIAFSFSSANLFARYISSCFTEVVSLNSFNIFDLNFLFERYPQLGGVRIKCSGRIQGAEIARSETITVGSVPLSCFCSFVDYGFSTAVTTHGLLGISVWFFFKGV